MIGKFTQDQFDGLADGADTRRIQARQYRHVGGRADGVGDDRTGAGDDVQVDTGGAQRHHDVGEQDRRVHIVPAHRLQRDLADHRRVEAGLEHAVVGADRPVFGKRATGLTHEPHRPAGGPPPGRGGDQRERGIMAA